MFYINDVSLHFGDRTLFNEVNFMLTDRDKASLVGKNGVGKTTLFKIISGQMGCDSGTIDYPKDFSIGYLKQDIDFNNQVSLIDEVKSCNHDLQFAHDQLDKVNALLSDRTDYESDAYMDLLGKMSEASDAFAILEPDKFEAEVEKILKGLGFKSETFNNAISTFSGGWKMRIELAKLLLTKPSLLLLDEPTNHLDMESIIWLESYLKSYPGIVFVISHDKQFLKNVCKKTIELQFGKASLYSGDYDFYEKEKKERSEILQASFVNQQKMIAEKERTITRFMAKATKTSMAQSMQKQLDKLERIEVPMEDTKSMKIAFEHSRRPGRVVLEINDIYKSFGDNKVLSDISIPIERGDRIAFVGQNGKGKTTLAKIIVKNLKPTSGNVKYGSNVVINYYAQNQADTLDTSKTLLEVMEDAAPASKRTKIRGILGAFLFSGDDVEKKVSVLSGGERSRLAMAVMIMNPCNIVIMDEPTNHLDIQSKEVLKNALLTFAGTLIIVSHDREFLVGLSNKVYEFGDQGIKEYLGDINYFLNKKKMDSMREIDIKNKVPEESTKFHAPVDRNAQNKFKKKLKYIERDIEKVEKNIGDIDVKMKDPKFYMSEEFVKVSKNYKELQEKLDLLMIDWDLLAEKIV